MNKSIGDKQSILHNRWYNLNRVCIVQPLSFQDNEEKIL